MGWLVSGGSWAWSSPSEREWSSRIASRLLRSRGDWLMTMAVAVVSQSLSGRLSPSWARSSATARLLRWLRASRAPRRVSLPAVANTTHSTVTASVTAARRRGTPVRLDGFFIGRTS